MPGNAILVVTHHFSSVGGVETLTIRLAEALEMAGAKVAIQPVWLPSSPALETAALQRRLKILTPLMIEPEPSVWRSARGAELREGHHVAVARLQAKLRGGNFDSAVVLPLGGLIAAVRSCFSVPVVAFECTDPRSAGDEWYPDGLEEGLQFFDGVVAHTDAIGAAATLRFGCRYLGSVEPPIIPSPIPNARSASPLDVGVVSRFSKEKNVLAAVRAQQALIRKDPRWTLTLYGHGPDTNELRQEASRSHGIRIQSSLAPLVRRNDVASRHGTFVVPSRFEGRPSTALELLGTGRPVLASLQSGLGKYLPDAWQFDAGSAQELSTTLQYQSTLSSDARRETALSAFSKHPSPVDIGKKLRHLVGEASFGRSNS